MKIHKILLTLFATVLLFSCGQAPKETEETPKEDTVAANSNWATENLQGKVKTIEETTFTADSLGVISDMDSCCIEIKVFNDKGYVGSYTEKNNEGTIVYESLWERFEDGKWKSSKNTEDGEPSGGRMVTQDANGNTLHAIDTDGEGNIKYFYNDITENELGQALSGKMFTGDSTYMGTWTRTYDNGNWTGSSWSDSLDVLLNERTAELNEKRLISKYTSMKVDEEGTSTTEVFTYTYDSFDDAGNWTQVTEFDESGVVTEVTKRSYSYFE